MCGDEHLPGLDELLHLVRGRTGHFRLESGHHGSLWLELDRLFVRPGALLPFVRALAAQVSEHAVDGICGPLTGGAFLAQSVAAELGCEFYYTERVAATERGALYGAAYRLPAGLQPHVQGKRVAVVDDVINAGSAVRASVAALEACGATPTVAASLLLMGDAAPRHFAARNIPLAAAAQMPSDLWAPAECPLCAMGLAVEDCTGG